MFAPRADGACAAEGSGSLCLVPCQGLTAGAVAHGGCNAQHSPGQNTSLVIAPGVVWDQLHLKIESIGGGSSCGTDL